MSEDRTKPKPLWIVLDKNGNPWGPFETAEAADQFIKRQTGGGITWYWTVVALRHPDE